MFAGPSPFALLADARLFGQSFEFHDLFVVGLLIVLEGVLSIDNALVLGLLARRLPKRLQGKALTYGLIGALIFRIAAIATASILLRWTFARFLGGAYLVYVAVKHFAVGEQQHVEAIEVGQDGQPRITEFESALTGESKAGAAAVSAPDRAITSHSWAFWHTVLVIELTDIAFAVDSIVAAMALVGQQKPEDTGAHDKLWVVVTGGMIGVILMRFAAVLFIRLLERFPRFETSAYLLVAVIGVKLLIDWWYNPPNVPERVNFHSPHAGAFWVFWAAMLLCFCVGFIPRRETPASTTSGGDGH